MSDVSDLIAANWDGLLDAAGVPIRMPMFGNQVMPPGLQEELKEQQSKTSTAIGEGVENLLTDNGFSVVRTAELDELHVKANAFDGVRPPIAHLFCRRCGNKLVELNITRPERINTTIESLTANTACTCPR